MDANTAGAVTVKGVSKGGLSDVDSDTITDAISGSTADTTSDTTSGADAVLSVARLVLQEKGDSDEPICLFNLSRSSQKLEEWQGLLPRVTPHYAVKCNPDKEFLRELRTAGCNFDCATQAEIQQVLSIGGKPENIVFSHPCKLRQDLQFAKAKGVHLMSFDNDTELLKVAAVFPKARLLLRVVCEDTDAQCPMSSKFGAVKVDWDPLLAVAQELGLHVVGVSFHVGSGCKDPESFEKALSDSKEIFELAAARGFQMEVLDIGGGFPGIDTSEICFAPLATNVAKQLDNHFPVEAYPALRVIAEPGRFFACSSASLLTKVIAKAQPSGGEAESAEIKIFRYYLNDGVYGSFNCIIYDHAEVEPEMLKPSEGAVKSPCWMFGPTCDGFDVILKDYEMPELQEGDWLLWRNMGAYTTCAGSNFNGFALANSVYYHVDGTSPPDAESDGEKNGHHNIRFHQPHKEAEKTTDKTCKLDEQPAIFKSQMPEDELRKEVRRLHEEFMTKGKLSSLAWPSAAKCSLLLFCAFIWAFKTISFSWAVSKRQFSPFSPTIVQSAILALCIFVALLCRYGLEEVKLLANRKYFWFAVSGFLEGSMFCLHNLALTKMPATTVTVLMQGQVFIVLLLQATIFQAFPSAVQIACVASMVCLLFSYKLATSVDNGLDARSVMPAAYGAAFCSGACDLALEYFVRTSRAKATNQTADLMRCLFYHESFKIPIACIMLLAFDAKFASEGLFYGWDWSVALGGAGASALALIFVNASVVLYGALPTNLYGTLEVPIVYLLDIFVLRTGVFNSVTLLEMCCFGGMIAAYHLDVLTVLNWEDACCKASDSVRRAGQQMSVDFTIASKQRKASRGETLLPSR
jgi:ornithine decarboxylase